MEDTNYLAHYGILGQKWGIRRYQNEDGTLTPEGKERYGIYKMTEEQKQAHAKQHNYKYESPTETHQKMLKNARENDRWDISFLEYIPDTWTDPETGDFYDREVVLKEYAEYLEDPNKWAEKHLDENKFVKHAEGDMAMEDTNYLAHYGVEGQKWGVRRYQNEDGSLTPEGREHYGYSKEQVKNKQELHDARNMSAIKRAALLKARTNSSKPEDLQKAKAESREAVNNLARELKEYRKDKETRKIDQTVWKEQRRDYIQSKSIGEKLITGLLLGPAGLYNYNSLMAANTGVSKPFAFATSAISTLLTGGAGNIAASTIIADRVKEGY